jgi:hypothetical protein
MTKPQPPQPPSKPQPPQPPGLGYSVFSNPYPYNSPEYNAYRKYLCEIKSVSYRPPAR